MCRTVLMAAAMLAWLPFPGLAAPRVVTDLPPVGGLVAQVMQGVGTPEVLLGRDGDGHHHQLRPSEARAIAGADLLVWLGPAMTPSLGAAADSLAPGRGLALLDLPGTHLRPAEGEAEPATPQGHEHGHDHDHGAIDPHAWLDPANAALWLGAIAEALAAQDPDHADRYRANAAQGRDAIAAAAAEARALLRGQEVPVVVAHDALGYFTEAMGLPPALALAGQGDTAPSAGRLRRLREQIARSGATCLLPEAGHDGRGLAGLDGLGLREGAPLDLLGVTQGAVGPDLYPALLVGLARTIAGCGDRQAGIGAAAKSVLVIVD